MYFFFVRPPDTIDTLLFFAANAASQAFCGTESKKKRQISVEICRFFLVEMAGVEPASESILTGPSPGADGYCGNLLPCSPSNRQAVTRGWSGESHDAWAGQLFPRLTDAT